MQVHTSSSLVTNLNFEYSKHTMYVCRFLGGYSSINSHLAIQCTYMRTYMIIINMCIAILIVDTEEIK